MVFHYARDHDLAGFWGEVCELAHRVHREAALLPPTPIADLEKTLNIGPTQRLFCQVSACHQNVEVPAQALHEQVFFVLEFRIQARFAHTCGLFKVLNTRLSEAMNVALSRQGQVVRQGMRGRRREWSSAHRQTPNIPLPVELPAGHHHPPIFSSLVESSECSFPCELRYRRLPRLRPCGPPLTSGTSTPSAVARSI